MFRLREYLSFLPPPELLSSRLTGDLRRGGGDRLTLRDGDGLYRRALPRGVGLRERDE